MSESEYTQLKKRLRSTPFLVADGNMGEVRLVNEADSLRLMSESGLFHSQVIMNAGRALENFTQLTGRRDRSFSLRDIAAITGSPYHMVHRWLDEKVVVASIRPAGGSGKGKEPLFSWADAFAAGICGSLRRQGVGLDVLRKVSQIFAKSPKKKRATRKVATST